MHLEIPTFKRCCGCLPLRRGILSLGYLSLGFSIFFIWVELQYEQSWTEDTTGLFRGANFSAQKWIPVFMHCVEMAFLVVLLVGTHARKASLIRVYYYYGITTTAAMLAIYLLTLPRKNLPFFSYYVIDVCAMFSGIVIQGYLLLLIRSELQKPREVLHSVNHFAEVCGQPPA